MSTPRFFVEPLSEGSILLPAGEASHAARSRRLSVGDAVALFDGAGREAVGRIARIDKRAVHVEASDIVVRTRPAPALTLATALPKGPRQDVLIEKCTELGVAAIQPLETERSIAEGSARKSDKWRRTAIEAAKQSGQCWIPQFHSPCGLGELLGNAGEFDLTLVGTTERGRTGVTSLADCGLSDPKVRTILGLLGPEGGWSDGELSQLERAGVRFVSFGPNTLRIETAAIALAAAVHAVARQINNSK